jgi:hypothetical protein
MAIRPGGEMVDTGDLKSPGSNPVRVRVPPRLFEKEIIMNIEMVLSFVFVSTFSFFLMGIFWSRKGNINISFKTTWFILFGFGMFVISHVFFFLNFKNG